MRKGSILSKRIPELDGLRAFAVLAVVGFHYIPPDYERFTGLAFGWAGVDLFFVLSGFLITSILLGMREKPQFFSTFYARRAFRIFPPYFLLLSIYTIAVLGFGRSGGGKFLALQWLFLTSYFPRLTAHIPISHPEFVLHGLGVLWSLSIEEQFYLFWAPVVRYISPLRMRYFLLSLICVAPLVRWAVHVPGQFIEYFFMPARIDALSMGSFVALTIFLLERCSTDWAKVRKYAAWVAIAAIACAILYLGSTDWKEFARPVRGETIKGTLRFAVFGYSIIALSFASIIAYSALNTGRKTLTLSFLRIRPLLWIGNVSYVIYLIHYPARTVVAYLIEDVLHKNGVTAKLAIPALSLILTFTLARLSWIYFETPLLTLKDRLFPKERPLLIYGPSASQNDRNVDNIPQPI